MKHEGFDFTKNNGMRRFKSDEKNAWAGNIAVLLLFDDKKLLKKIWVVIFQSSTGTDRCLIFQTQEDYFKKFHIPLPFFALKC